jgi:methionyl-tRNA synthetase
MHLLTETNRYLEEKAPWKTAKTDLATAGASLYVALEILRISGSLLLPVMPEKMRSLLQTIGASVNPQWSELATWAIIAPGTKVEKAEPLFPRVELKDSET